MKVLKFGGTSVGTVESLRNVKKIVDSIKGKAIIVVSALGGLTDQLINTAKMAENGDTYWKENWKTFVTRHHKIISNFKLEALCLEAVDSLLQELKKDYEKVFDESILTSQMLDHIVAYGERMSSHIVAALVNNGKRYYSPDFIKTETWYNKNVAEREITERLIGETFRDMTENEKAIVPGFISSDFETGLITNLGRGGSDYTGALIAAAMGADILEIWTDVDGFMTADPRIVKDALLIDRLSFTESMQLCNFGAKVVYPPTIYPVFHARIPIKILNTFNADAPGTLISDRSGHEDFDIKGVTSLKGISMFSIPVLNPSEIENQQRSILTDLSKSGITSIPFESSEDPSQIRIALVGVDNSLEINNISGEIEPGYAVIAVVGKSMLSRQRLGERIRQSLLREGIPVAAHSLGFSTTFLYLLSESDIPRALPLIHSLLY